MAFDEIKHPRDRYGKFTDKPTTEQKTRDAVRKFSDTPQKDLDALGVGEKKKMTPAEKIASVHIDFNRDNVLPELNEDDLKKVGAMDNKPVLLKKRVIDRNAIVHSDLSNEDFQSIVAHALYEPSEVFSANENKPYFHFAKVIEMSSKEKSEIGIVLLDVDETKDNFEIVHAHFVRERSFRSMQKRQK